MNNKSINTQAIFLNHLRIHKNIVNIFLSNGVRLLGVIKGFDEFTIILDSKESGQVLLYKHSISSIVPCKAVTPIKGVE